MGYAFTKRITRILLTISSFILISFLISCADLGKFDLEADGGYEDYYEAFGDVVGKYDNNKTVAEISYDVEKSLLNDYIANNLAWENDEDKVEFKQYCYIVIPFERDMKIESIALYISGSPGELQNNSSMNVEFSAYYYPDSSSVPSNIKLLTSDDTKVEDDKEVEIVYDDPARALRVSSYTLNVTSYFADAIILENFTQTLDFGVSYVADSCLEVKDGSYLYIRVENNSGLNRDTMKPLSISFINFLVRAI